ncbi:MAG: alpha-galactosidase [Oscillospiraceae bacterium]|jgi:alpha-galactosidase|nr:alpha-galactosidase [Oscillospiraceae bacterium]
MKKLVSLALAALLVCMLVPTVGLAYDTQAGGTNVALPPVTDPDWQSPFNDARLVGRSETGLLPAMGWNSWNAFQTNINANLIKRIADSFIRLGLDKAGYEYVVIDDGCYNASLIGGTLSNHTTNFPLGFKDMSDYVHNLGLKYGMYQDSGARTCGGQPGAYGREDLFAQTMVDWGVDYIKYDFCGNTWDNDRYGRAPNIRSLTVRASDGGFEQKINALDAVASGSVTKNTTDNFVSGIGIGSTAGTPTTPYADLTFTVTAPAAGTYTVVIENSANGTGTGVGRYLMLDVNGTRRFETLVPSTGSVTVMQNTETSAELAEGENTLRIYNVKRAESALYSMAAFKDALVKAGGESVRFSICEWGYNSPWTWAHKVGDSYRITTDIANKVSEGQYSWMKYQYDRAVILDKYTGLDKAWADPDMLVVGLKDTDKALVDGVRPYFTHEEDIQHFTAWCMMNAPLMLGMDLTKVEVGDPVWQVITNRDVIALDQDPLGVQAKRLKTTATLAAMDAFTTASRMDIIAKPLANGDVAVMFVNVGSTTRTLGISADEILAGLAGKLADAEAFAAAETYTVKDLWSKSLSTLAHDATLTMTVAAHGSRTFRLSPSDAFAAPTYAVRADGGDTLVPVYALSAAAGQTLTLSFDALRARGAAQPVTAIAALYDAAGRLVRISTAAGEAEAGLVKSFSLDMAIPEDAEGLSLRLLVWESGTLRPLTDAADFT